jgi:hypothetical protein
MTSGLPTPRHIAHPQSKRSHDQAQLRGGGGGWLLVGVEVQTQPEPSSTATECHAFGIA